MAVQTLERPFRVEWVQKLFRELTGEERETVQRAFGLVPWHGHDDEGAAELWRKVETGDVAAFTARDEASGRILLVTFYQVQTLKDGAKNFHSLASAALEPGLGDWTATGMPLMEKVARHHGCQSMSMHTLRPGLAKQLTAHHGWFASEIVLRKTL